MTAALHTAQLYQNDGLAVRSNASRHCHPTSPVDQSGRLAAKFSILLTGNHYDGSTLDRKLLTANHCVLFYLILIEKQLTSSPKLSPASFPPHQ